MSALNILTNINWLLISLYGAYVIYHLLQANGPTDAAGQGLESAVKGVFFVALLVLIGLNLLPYIWIKSIGLLLGILLLWMVYYIYTH
ncbi:hypothetical protein EXU85_18760 [Spirosoma sp. KCTC 42546]|uniref:hypothetical protein n=1 Tax=Spirosoma sp. KCTC 42546 TaxID=2520506 RepID=UPI00115832E0|nr:hypothetical protein [Spirosoma sp. KCTC 42546]QDK80535.1 hypothetical protein EXU85_18760 [Spirosoma sp. KCTC 42546]